MIIEAMDLSRKLLQPSHSPNMMVPPPMYPIITARLRVFGTATFKINDTVDQWLLKP
jgi:hypothetical protein